MFVADYVKVGRAPIRGMALCLLLSGAAGATTDYYRPAGAAQLAEVVAGYRALFACSAHFIANRTLEEIQRIELVDTHAFELPAPVIDPRQRLVKAAGPDGQVAIAVHRETMGCTLLPPDWLVSDIPKLPHTQLAPAPEVESIEFPLGDKAVVRPNRGQRALLKRAFDGESFGAGCVSGAVLVIKNGKLVGERYGNGFGVHSGYRTWSTAKSISATLIGIAIRDGLMKRDTRAPIAQWQFAGDPRRAITIEHLLHMSSGLESQGSNTNAIYFGGAQVASAVTQTPLEAEPGSRWKYANNDTLLLLRSLRHVLRDDQRYLRYPYDELFHRIGMHHTRMELDHAGDFIGSSQVYTTARDLARFGLLYLNDGVWESERILPEGWAKFVAQPAPSRPLVQGEAGYGAQFWLYDGLPGVPAGTYTTSGNKGQFVTIVPRHNMVVVRTGVDPLGKRWQQAAFVAEVIKQF